MIRALFTSATGMKVQQTNVDVIANNLANVNTTGFKKSQTNFQDLLYVVAREPGVRATQSLNAFSSNPSGMQIGSGAEVLSTTKIFTPGVLNLTERELDLALQGDGFFQVQHPSGVTAYTRDGSLRIDNDGNLTTAQGYQVLPITRVPPDAQSVTITADGTISVRGTDNIIQEIGTLLIARFQNNSGLRAAGGNLFFETDASGAAVEVTPGEDGTGTVQQGFLEGSNVDVVRELVSLITAQRAYEVNSRAIRVGDEMLQDVNTLVR